MKKGDYVRTPRFHEVFIEEIFETEDEARKAGYIEPTHYNFEHNDYNVVGKTIKTDPHIGVRDMEFAAYKIEKE